MRSVAAHGGRWQWVPEEETDDSREGQVWGPACMPGVWMAYVNQGKPITKPLDVVSVPPIRVNALNCPVMFLSKLMSCVSVCCDLFEQTTEL